ncbi:3-dehydrosphinganine reductase TSC10B-like isoform X2 [Wolffia australiana]
MSSLLILLILIVFVPAALILLFLSFIVRPNPVKIPIKGRHVFITGGSSGIGLAVAMLSAREGARISILARSLSKLQEARDLIRLHTGVEVAIFSCDVRDYAGVREAVEAAGPIDVLICSHGVFVPEEVETQSVEDIKFMVDVNLMGTFHLIKAALPGMKRGGLPRSISILSSQAGQAGFYGYTAYSASKFALRGLAEALQQEVINNDIHVSLVFPPDTDTPGFQIEKKIRPSISNKLSGDIVPLNADDVAKMTLKGIKAGRFIVHCNFEGLMLAVATTGMAPQRSFFMAFCEVLFIGLLRIVSLCYLRVWYGIIQKHGPVNS